MLEVKKEFILEKTNLGKTRSGNFIIENASQQEAANLRIQELEKDLQSAIAENQRLAAEVDKKMRQAAARAELLAKLSQAFAEAGLDYQAVLRTIAQRVAGTLGDICIIWLLSYDKHWLEPVSYDYSDIQKSPTNDHFLAGVRLNVKDSPFDKVFQLGYAVVAPESAVEDTQNYHSRENLPWLDQLPMHSALFVTLRAQSNLIGVLSILNSKPAFAEDDIPFYQDLASRAALAIENARLYEVQAQRARELDALQTATAALLTTIDLETLLGQILDAAMSAIPAAEKGTLHLIARDTGQLQIRAMQGYSDPRIQKFSMPKSSGYLAKAVNERKPLLINGSHRDPAVSYESGAAETNIIQAALVAPLILGDKTLGAVSLNSSKSEAFTEADLRLLTSFATTTTTALHNAILHSEVQKLALTDPLTEFYNRRGFFELGQREIERYRRFERPLSLIMLDLDNFKEVNDRFGHAAGDHVLQILSDRVRASVRGVDILGRYGGDEFIMLLPETDLFSACSVAERIRKAISDPITLPALLLLSQSDSVVFTASASFGVTKATKETQDLAALLEQADAATYIAKRAGGNRVEVG